MALQAVELVSTAISREDLMQKQNTQLVIMVETAVLVGAALALSMVRLIRLPGRLYWR